MIQEIQDKLFDLQTKGKSLHKIFRFSSTDLADNSNKCLEEISGYIEKHSNNIVDYDFDSWTDEETMGTVILLRMRLTPILDQALMSSPAIHNLLSTELQYSFLLEEITNLMSLYSFEFNTEDTRKEICARLYDRISPYISENFNIVDRTSIDEVDKDATNFRAKLDDDKEITLFDLLDRATSKNDNE
jgi:hypothetical protein